MFRRDLRAFPKPEILVVIILATANLLAFFASLRNLVNAFFLEGMVAFVLGGSIAGGITDLGIAGRHWLAMKQQSETEAGTRAKRKSHIRLGLRILTIGLALVAISVFIGEFWLRAALRS